MCIYHIRLNIANIKHRKHFIVQYCIKYIIDDQKKQLFVRDKKNWMLLKIP